MPRLQQVLRGIKISQAESPKTGTAATPRSRLPIIHRHYSVTSVVHGLDALWIRIRSCFGQLSLHVSFGFMHSGELCIQDTTKGFDATTDLSFQDVAVDNYSNPSFLRIHWKTSKSDPFCKGTYILLGRTRDELCPVAALLQWMVQRGNAPGPLFKFVSGVPLTRPLLVSRPRTFIQQMGGDPSGFSGHSFRSGAATSYCCSIGNLRLANQAVGKMEE